MKKIITIVLITSAISLQAQEFQNPVEEKVAFSVKAGYLNSTLKGSDKSFLASDGKINSFNNIFAGVSVDNPIGKNFSLKHELFYQNYGGKFKRELSEDDLDAELSMHSLRLNPISLAYRFGDLHLFAGPYINMLLSSSITAIDEQGNLYKDHDIFGTETENQEEGDFLQNMDYGFVIGAEYQLNFGGIIGVQYSKGFASIFDNSNTYDIFGPAGPEDLKIYNQTLGVYLGFQF
ncbi:MAG TPA: outer membrane beta-barrel protein [Flavobacteriaceae bacterium]|nr:outer membrane beta-barrel protein [Flavobacteriaceae bacterium]